MHIQKILICINNVIKRVFAWVSKKIIVSKKKKAASKNKLTELCNLLLFYLAISIIQSML